MLSRISQTDVTQIVDNNHPGEGNLPTKPKKMKAIVFLKLPDGDYRGPEPFAVYKKEAIEEMVNDNPTLSFDDDGNVVAVIN